MWGRHVLLALHFLLLIPWTTRLLPVQRARQPVSLVSLVAIFSGLQMFTVELHSFFWGGKCQAMPTVDFLLRIGIDRSASASSLGRSACEKGVAGSNEVF